MSSDQNNPYSSPATMPQVDADKQQSTTGKVHPASQGKRFLNMIVDSVVLFGINYGVGMVAAEAFVAVTNGEFTQEQLVAFQIGSFFLGWIVSAIYYTGFELTFGKTLGKFVTGTTVVSADGSPPSPGQIIGRSLCRFIPFEAFSFFGGAGRPVGWHDSISGTRVIETR